MRNRVKQLPIKYLGSIRQRHIPFVGARIKFWEKAEKRLSTLNLPKDDMHSVISMMQKKVMKPSETEIKEFKDLVSARRE